MGQLNRIMTTAFFVSLALSGCYRMKDTKAEITYFDHGQVIPVEMKDSDQFFNLVNDLILGTDETIKLLVSTEQLETIRQTEACVEIVFQKAVFVRSRKLGIFRIDRILIPFEGEFVGEETDPTLTVFLGKGTYFSGPIRNSQGFGFVQEIRALLEEK